MRSPPTILAALLAVATLASSERSDATELAPRLHVDWVALTRALEGPRVERAPAPPSIDALLGEPSETSRARVVATDSAPWIETPTAVLSVVARNWEGASHLVGGPLSSSDAIRVSRSSRMLLGRAALDVGRIAPFVQVGVGQWRDPDPHVVLPVMQYAAQAGAGIEVSILDGLGVALEWDWTAMYLESHRAEAVASHYLGWGEAFAAVRWNFEVGAPAAGAGR